MNSDPFEPMDSSLMQLERELFSLTPAEPARRVFTRLEEEMAPAAPVQVRRRTAAPQRQPVSQWKRVVMPAAAAVAVVAVINRNSTGGPVYGVATLPPPNPADSIPGSPLAAAARSITPLTVSQSRELRAARDQGFVFGEGSSPSRAVSWETTDHHFWRNEQDNSVIQLSIPRQESTLMPVNFH